MPNFKFSYSNKKLANILLRKISEAEKIALLKQEFLTTPLDPSSTEAANLLHNVIYENFYNLFIFLISEISIDINLLSTPNKRTPFASAAIRGRISILKELTKRGADNKSPDIEGKYPLHLAAERNLHETVKYLIDECKADVHQKTNNSFSLTALQLAVYFNKSTKTVRALIQRGANYKSPWAHGYYPLHSACARGCHEMVEYFITLCKFDINQRTNDRFGSTPCQIAILYNQFEILQLLIKHGANHQLKNSLGAISLSYVTTVKQMEIFIFLVNILNDHHLWTREGSHGIHLAAMNNLPEMIAYLVKEKKTDVNLLSKRGYTALHVAVRNKSIHALKKLVELKADYQQTDQAGFYPIHFTFDSNMLDYLVNVLNVDVNQQTFDENGLTALHYSIQYYNPAAFQKLLELKADVNKRNKLGEYPLHIAAKNGRNKMVQQLINTKKVTINSLLSTSLQSTPLTQAIYGQHVEATRILIENKGKITMQIDEAKALAETFDLFTENNKRQNQALLLLAMQHFFYRKSLFKLAYEKKFAWLSMALYHDDFLSSMLTWGKKKSPNQLAILFCLASHYDFNIFYKFIHQTSCTKQVKDIVDNAEFKFLAESQRQFLKKKDAMYYEILHAEEVAKIIQTILYTQRNFFLQLPAVLFDLIFDFISDQSLSKTKPSAVLDAMLLSSSERKINNLYQQRGLFFKILLSQSETSTAYKKTSPGYK